jgi:uncharacterized DUF497 family protein
MEFEWDEGKDAANRAKHGVSLAEAARLDWEKGGEEMDDRNCYGEIRMVRHALLDGRLHVCVYTLRNHIYRIISLRKANEREKVRHGI